MGPKSQSAINGYAEPVEALKRIEYIIFNAKVVASKEVDCSIEAISKLAANFLAKK